VQLLNRQKGILTMATLHASLASHVNAANRRSLERVDVAIWSQVRIFGQPAFPARISNLSATGCMFFSPCPITDYAAVHVELPRIGWVKATALWSLGDKIGAEFENLIPAAEFVLLRPFL
jgi:PilZ domain